MIKLPHHSWPGNIRDLRNFIERLVAFHADNASIDEHNIKLASNEQLFQFSVHLLDRIYEAAKEMLLHEFKQVYFKRALQKHNGNISAAAKESGLNRVSLHKILRKLRTG